MNPPQAYEAIVLGGGKGGKTLATELGDKGVEIPPTQTGNGTVIITAGAKNKSHARCLKP